MQEKRWQEKKVSEFPLLQKYKEVFPITERTVFAYDNVIYTNYPIPSDLAIHEQTHFKQQKKHGLNVWVDKYLNDKAFRLRMEIQAYRKQLESIKDRELKNKIRMESARHLSSDLYGNLLTYEEALNILR